MTRLIRCFALTCFLLDTFALAAGRVALISMDREGVEYFHMAQEAIDNGANILLFPEWGFTPQPDVTREVIEKWRLLADEQNVFIGLSARYQERNALFVFTPEGGRYLGFRRDGHNSPYPEEPMYQRPVVVDSPHGRLGFLICDESRSEKFLTELKSYNVDAVLVPNKVGATLTAEALQQRAAKLGYWTDVFSVDFLGPYGNQTHVYRHDSQTILVNAFGQDVEIGDRAQARVDDDGIKYQISYHDLGSP